MHSKLLHRRQRKTWLLVLGAMLGLAWRGAPAMAATKTWMGAGASGVWSDAANWSGGVPGLGDDVAFGGNPPWLINTLDFSLELNLVTFGPDSENFFLHVAGVGGTTLNFSGAGIENLTSDVGRPGHSLGQRFIADAGATGGTILFTNSANTNINMAAQVVLTAAGGTTAGAVGGRLIFQDTSSTSLFTELEAKGASVAGAGAGEIRFREGAVMRNALVTANGGTGAGAAGGSVVVENDARVEGSRFAIVSSVNGGGLAASLTFRNNAVADFQTILGISAAFPGVAGFEATAQFFDDARLEGLATVGGRLEFHDRANLKRTDSQPDESIYNDISYTAGAVGGRTIFFDDSFIAGANASIRNASDVIEGDEAVPAPGYQGGVTEFRDRSRAGQVAIINGGAIYGTAGTLGGRTLFSGSASAEAATVQNLAGTAASAPGGLTEFGGAATAGQATITNFGGLASGTTSGFTSFLGTSSAGASTIFNLPKTGAAASSGGIASFFDDSKAGTATITNQGGTFAAGANPSGGWTLFAAGASAQQATITNQRPTVSGGGSGETVFYGNVVGKTVTADRATIINEGGQFVTQRGGVTTFKGSATAGAAVLTNGGALQPNAFGGSTDFLDTADGGTASFLNQGGAVAMADGGFLGFSDNSSAAHSTIVNEGGSAANAAGGIAIFFDNSTAGQATLRGLAGAASAGGGRFVFLNLSEGGTARVILDGTGAEAAELIVQVTDAGMGIGSIEGTGTVSLGGRTLSVGTRNVDTEFSGLIRDGGAAGRLIKVGTAMQTLAGDSTYTGGTTVADGILRVTNANGLGLGTGPVTVQPSAVGELGFFDTASAGTVAITNNGSVNSVLAATTFYSSATAGTASFVNAGSLANGAYGGRTVFFNTARAGSATFDNRGSTFLGGGGGIGGGDLFFVQASTADAATIFNQGGLASSAEGGQTNFFDSSSGGTANITNFAANATGAFAGATVFRSLATAGGATIQNAGSSSASMSAGTTEFFDTATAGSAIFSNAGGTAASAPGGQINFFGSSSGGTATLNNRATTVSNAFGGKAVFNSFSDAAASTIVNEGGKLAFHVGGFTEFRGASNGGSGLSTNGAGQVASALGGATSFYDTARAGTRQFINQGAVTGYAGSVFFDDNSSADASTITNLGKTMAAGVSGGGANFLGSAKAGTATINNEGSNFLGFGGGLAQFQDSASAELATINNRAALSATGGPGITFFLGGTADRATITNDGGLFANGLGGETDFTGAATAGTATLRNAAGQVTSAFGGATLFSQTSTAGSAVILNQAGIVAGAAGGVTTFLDSGNAGNATITAEGASVAGGGSGRISFNLNSGAGNSTLIVQGGTNGGQGGILTFADNATGGTARLVINAGGTLDIGSLAPGPIGLSTGSLEGAGNVILGGKLLQVGSVPRTTVFSGVIADGVPGGASKGLSTTGGALTLTGANTYTTGTVIGNGVTANSGKLIAANISGSATGTGPVTIRRGGTLSGSGFIAGPVTLQAGGAIVPGDPVTLTLEDDLTWDGGSVIRLALGPDQAGSDRLDISGTLIRGDDSGGAFTFDLVDFGAVVGQTYDFIHFANLQGFTAQAFTFTGMEGNFAIGANALAFTVTSVPEPGSAVLAMCGALVLALRRASAHRPHPR